MSVIADFINSLPFTHKALIVAACVLVVIAMVVEIYEGKDPV